MRGLVVIIVMLALLSGLWVGWGLGSAQPAAVPPVAAGPAQAPAPSPAPTQDLEGLIYAASSNAADVAEGRAIQAVQTAEAGWRATEEVLWATREADLVNRSGRAGEVAALQVVMPTPEPTPPWPHCAHAAAGEVCIAPTSTPRPNPTSTPILCSHGTVMRQGEHICTKDGPAPTPAPRGDDS